MLGGANIARNAMRSVLPAHTRVRVPYDYGASTIMKIKNRRWLLAFAAVLSSMAFAGIGASGAQALSPCGGGNIQGQGSSLQGAAQTIWTTGHVGETGFNRSTSGGCIGGPTVRYSVTSSGGCLTGFGGRNEPLNTTFAYCGTDDAPNALESETINTATSSKLLTIPVAQAAIAVVANPPSGCAITNITPSNLEQVFRGTITSWTTIGSSGTCNSSINRVVRADSSGTTYQLKHYLFNQTNTNVHAGTTWAGLQAGANNTTWPGAVVKSTTQCNTAMSLPCGAGVAGSGGGDEVRTVGATDGSIGYAALSDARSVTTALATTDPRLKWITVGGINPSSNGLTTTKAQSNCPTGNGSYTGLPATGATGDWSGVYAGTAGLQYPICTLTWDLAVANYTAFGGVSVGRTVRDFLHYTLTGGVADALTSANDYKQLPTDVLNTATAGVNEITG